MLLLIDNANNNFCGRALQSYSKNEVFFLSQKMVFLKTGQILLTGVMITLLFAYFGSHECEAAPSACTRECWGIYRSCISQAKTEDKMKACIQARYLCLDREACQRERLLLVG